MVVARADYNNERRYWYIINGVNTPGDSTNRCRLQFRFMLDVSKDEDRDMALWLEELKRGNQFTPTVRNAMALNYGLQEDRIDELTKQFPRIVENIEKRIKDKYTREISEKDKRITELETENRMKDEHIERLERLLASRPPQAQSDAPTLRNAPPPKAAQAEFSGDLLEVTQAKADVDNNSSYNFMIASAIQVYGNFDALPPDIIEYGVRTGRIPADRVKLKSAPKKEKVMVESEERTPGGLRKLQGGDVALSVPDFDDMEL